MAPQTKEKAKAKLKVLKVGVGYPDKWRDYSGLEVVRGDALGNSDRAALFDYQRNLKKLGSKVDRADEESPMPQIAIAWPRSSANRRRAILPGRVAPAPRRMRPASAAPHHLPDVLRHARTAATPR